MVIRGIDGLNGKGIASTSYNSGTGVLAITFTDSSIYQTGDLRGVNGKGISSASYNSSTGILTLTFTDSSTYQTTDLRGVAGPNQVTTTTATNINGLLKGNGSVVSQAQAGTDFVAPNDARMTDARTPTDTSVTYGRVANALKTKATVTSTVNLSANGQGAITLTGNTAFSFSGFELNKTYLLIITPNGFTASWAVGAKHVPVDGNAAFATTGVFYVSLTCIDATSGSEKLLTVIMKGA